MPLHSDTLHTMMGRLKQVKPNAGAEAIKTWLNDAVRDTINRRTYWADLGYRGVISIPDAYATGTIATTRGSAVVAGSGTLWAIGDIVNTTMVDSVAGGTYEDVALASMAGIAEDLILTVDAGNPQQEMVPITRVNSDTITALFRNPHNAGTTVSVSSLAGLQLRTGSSYPIFTVLGVTSATELLIDNQWGGPALAGVAYQIIKMYTSLVSNIRRLDFAVDQRQGNPIDVTRLTQSILQVIDPQRSNTSSDPASLVPMSPSPSGNQQWEIWPASTSSRQLPYLCSRQWPLMENLSDVPPPFLDPVLFVRKAMAEALRTKIPVGPKKEDPWYDLKAADVRERDYEQLLATAMNNDEDRHTHDYQINVRSMMGMMSGTWNQSHVGIDAMIEGF